MTWRSRCIARSTHWASDLAKGFDIPIIHVNADDVEACISAARLAFAFREEFGHDVLIDLIGYRRFGHNESDEPSYTQPEMYATIKGKKRVSELWADELIHRKVITPPDVERERQAAWNELTSRHQALKEQIAELRESGVAEHQTGEYLLDIFSNKAVLEQPRAVVLRRFVAEGDRTQLHERGARIAHVGNVVFVASGRGGGAECAGGVDEHRDARGARGPVDTRDQRAGLRSLISVPRRRCARHLQSSVSLCRSPTPECPALPKACWVPSRTSRSFSPTADGFPVPRRRVLARAGRTLDDAEPVG